MSCNDDINEKATILNSDKVTFTKSLSNDDIYTKDGVIECHLIDEKDFEKIDNSPNVLKIQPKYIHEHEITRPNEKEPSILRLVASKITNPFDRSQGNQKPTTKSKSKAKQIL